MTHILLREKAPYNLESLLFYCLLPAHASNYSYPTVRDTKIKADSCIHKFKLDRLVGSCATTKSKSRNLYFHISTMAQFLSGLEEIMIN